MKKYIKEMVYEYPTKYDMGFTPSELQELLNKCDIDINDFNKKMFGNTCAIIDDEIITYHHDVVVCIMCIIENREQTFEEWD